MPRVKGYYKGETVVVVAETVNPNTGDALEPDSVKVSVYDSKNGPEVDSENMIKDSTGNYHYDVNTAGFENLGTCTVVITAVSGGRSSIGKDYFHLEEQVEELVEEPE